MVGVVRHAYTVPTSHTASRLRLYDVPIVGHELQHDLLQLECVDQSQPFYIFSQCRHRPLDSDSSAQLFPRPVLRQTAYTVHHSTTLPPYQRTKKPLNLTSEV